MHRYSEKKTHFPDAHLSTIMRLYGVQPTPFHASKGIRIFICRRSAITDEVPESLEGFNQGRSQLAHPLSQSSGTMCSF
jgi:hypothetical protein